MEYDYQSAVGLRLEFPAVNSQETLPAGASRLTGKVRERLKDSILGYPATDRLHDLQADFSLLLGTGFANPDHAASLGVGRLFVEDKFDHLAAPKVETCAQPEAFFRGIEDEAGEPLRLAVQIDYQAGAPLQHYTLRAAGFEDSQAGHSLLRGV
jgi:hypothetical protein